MLGIARRYRPIVQRYRTRRDSEAQPTATDRSIRFLVLRSIERFEDTAELMVWNTAAMVLYCHEDL